MITMILADDDAIIREGLKMIIETQPDITLIGMARDGREAVDLCRQLRPDVIMLDIRMPVLDGIDAATIILAEKLSAPLLLTTFDESELIMRALKAGVLGYILKNSPAERILSAIRTIAAGGTVFGQDILGYIREQVSRKTTENSVFELMSVREMEVVELIAEGLSNKEIAARLFISDGTVRNHISTIMEKAGLEHRTQIAVKYLSR
ncbi:MAG: response regulator transcription factor [Oscillospiraceae bacterium]|nr:response regulator transcription factor [Oscillospiraceae bacterium]